MVNSLYQYAAISIWVFCGAKPSALKTASACSAEMHSLVNATELFCAFFTYALAHLYDCAGLAALCARIIAPAWLSRAAQLTACCLEASLLQPQRQLRRTARRSGSGYANCPCALQHTIHLGSSTCCRACTRFNYATFASPPNGLCESAAAATLLRSRVAVGALYGWHVGGVPCH